MNLLLTVPIAVLNSLWQAAILAALVWLALRFGPRVNAATRFAVWWTTLAIVLILPVAPRLTAIVGKWIEPATLTATRPLYGPSASPAKFVELPPLVTVEQHKAARWPLWFAAAWGLILLYGLAQLLRSYLYINTLKGRAFISSYPLPRTGRTARVLISSELTSPIAVGFLRPAVILPASLPAELTREELDYVLLHEGAHLARWDDWTNLLGRVLGAALLLHPVALWILRRIDIEREAACDDWVVARTRSVRPYAQSLVRLYELCVAADSASHGTILASGLFEGSSQLRQRIEALLGRGSDFTPFASFGRVTVGITSLIALGVLASMSPDWIAFAQAPRPAFDVAAIKHHPEESNRLTFAVREGGRLDVVNSSISNAIGNAYGVENYQLIGAPDWVNSERYDIEAKGSATAGQKEIMLMLQTLLADRFAMRSHFETREIPAYILTVAKGGPKLQFLGSDDCVGFDPAKTNPTEIPNVCGNNIVGRNGWIATHISMPGVTGLLSSVMRRPVIDQTGIKGSFNVRLQWSDDLSLQESPADGPPSIYTALRESLGLELRSGRGPAQVLVIDHIERPTEN